MNLALLESSTRVTSSPSPPCKEEKLLSHSRQDAPFHPETCPDQVTLTLAHFLSECHSSVFSHQNPEGPWSTREWRGNGRGYGGLPRFPTLGPASSGVPNLAVVVNLAAAIHSRALLPLSCRHLLSNSWRIRPLDT